MCVNYWVGGEQLLVTAPPVKVNKIISYLKIRVNYNCSCSGIFTYYSIF